MDSPYQNIGASPRYFWHSPQAGETAPFDVLAVAHIIQSMLNYTTQATDEKRLLQLFKALSHANRLRILDMLMEGVQCNCEIAERLHLSLSLISHHMRVLEDAGLIKSERDSEDARWIYYSIDQEALLTYQDSIKAFLDVSRIQLRCPSCGPGSCNSS